MIKNGPKTQLHTFPPASQVQAFTQRAAVSSQRKIPTRPLGPLTFRKYFTLSLQNIPTYETKPFHHTFLCITLKPAPYNLNPEARTLEPEHYNQNPRARTLEPESYNQNPRTRTLEPEPYNQNPITRTLEPEPYNQNPIIRTR